MKLSAVVRSRGARHQCGGIRDGTLEIARQRSKKLYARRRRDEGYRARRHVVSRALQHRPENGKGGRAHDFGLERFGNPQPLKNLCKGLSRFDTVKNDQIGAQQSVLEFLDGRYVMRGTVDTVTKADTDVADHRSIPGAHFARIGKRLDKIRLDDNNVGDLAVFDPLFYGGPRVARQSHLIVRLAGEKGRRL